MNGNFWAIEKRREGTKQKSPHPLQSLANANERRSIRRKQKRFSKWLKPDSIEAIDAIKQYYGYSNEKARTVLRVLSKQQIDELKLFYETKQN